MVKGAMNQEGLLFWFLVMEQCCRSMDVIGVGEELGGGRSA